MMCSQDEGEAGNAGGDDSGEEAAAGGAGKSGGIPRSKAPERHDRPDVLLGWSGHGRPS